MLVRKRDGRLEPVQFDKITRRIETLCEGLSHHVSPIEITKKVIAGLYDGVTTKAFDVLAAETAATISTLHPDYNKLAGRIEISNLHKETSNSFVKTRDQLHTYINPTTQEPASLLDAKIYRIIKEHAALLDETIVYQRDYNYDYFGVKTLQRSYLLRINNAIVERPQHMLMRVAIGIHQEDMQSLHAMGTRL